MKHTSPLEPPDTHYLSAAEGWLELGNAEEALAELARLSPAQQIHPVALAIRFQILAQRQQWDPARAIAEQLVLADPENPAGWLHRSYATRRASSGGLLPAWEALHPAAELFPEEVLIAFNLACYATQLGRLDEGWEWFLRATQISKDPSQTRRMALADDDLKPLWERIRESR